MQILFVQFVIWLSVYAADGYAGRTVALIVFGGWCLLTIFGIVKPLLAGLQGLNLYALYHAIGFEASLPSIGMPPATVLVVLLAVIVTIAWVAAWAMAAQLPAPASHPERIYLDVPYARKDEARDLGARWAPVVKKWYVPADVNPEPLLAKFPKSFCD